MKKFPQVAESYKQIFGSIDFVKSHSSSPEEVFRAAGGWWPNPSPGCCGWWAHTIWI